MAVHERQKPMRKPANEAMSFLASDKIRVEYLILDVGHDENAD